LIKSETEFVVPHINSYDIGANQGLAFYTWNPCATAQTHRGPHVSWRQSSTYCEPGH